MAQMGYTEIPIPDDHVHLTKNVGYLETAFQKTNAILAELTSSILRPKTRERVAHGFWALVRQQSESSGW